MELRSKENPKPSMHHFPKHMPQNTNLMESLNGCYFLKDFHRQICLENTGKESKPESPYYKTFWYVQCVQLGIFERETECDVFHKFDRGYVFPHRIYMTGLQRKYFGDMLLHCRTSAQKHQHFHVGN